MLRGTREEVTPNCAISRFDPAKLHNSNYILSSFSLPLVTLPLYPFTMKTLLQVLALNTSKFIIFCPDFFFCLLTRDFSTFYYDSRIVIVVVEEYIIIKASFQGLPATKKKRIRGFVSSDICDSITLLRRREREIVDKTYKNRH